MIVVSTDVGVARASWSWGMKKVAIIGAGAAGLCCAKHLCEEFSVRVYEMTGGVGGTWVYTDNTGCDEVTGLPIHSSMYHNLKYACI